MDALVKDDARLPLRECKGLWWPWPPKLASGMKRAAKWMSLIGKRCLDPIYLFLETFLHIWSEELLNTQPL